MIRARRRAPGARDRGLWVWPLAVLIVGWALTAALAVDARHDSQVQALRRLQAAARDTRSGIDNAFSAYLDHLEALAAYYAASGPDQAELSAYGGQLQLTDRHPGFRGIAIVSAVPTPDGRDRFLLTASLAGPPAGLGRDLGAYPARREALERARDTGQAALTARLTLLSDETLGPADRQPGFALYLPIYRDGAPVATVEERRAALIGFAATSFRAPELLASVPRSQGAPVGFEVFDGPAAAGASVARFPASANNGRTWDETLDLFGRRWTARFWTLPGFPVPSEWERLGLCLVGALFSAALAAVVHLLLRDRRRLARAVAHATESLGELEARYGELEAIASGAFDTTSVGMAVNDVDGRYLRVNRPMVAITGRTADELAATNVLAITHPDDRDATRDAMQRSLAGDPGAYPIEKRLVRPDGETVWVRVHVNWVRDADGAPLYCIAAVEDVTEQVSAAEAVTWRVFHDELTDLPNRALLLDRLGHALAQRPGPDCAVAVLFCDIDRFKVVNDSLGHAAGDALLVEVAHRLMAAVRPGDTVARQGGDEFVVVAENMAGAHEAAHLAERIRLAVSRPLTLPGGESVSASVSIGIMLAQGQTAEEALRDADTALYQAKGAGRDRYAFFTEQLREEAVRRLDTEGKLRRALDGHDVVVHYQPIVDLESAVTVGCEALLRVQTDGRLLRPLDFLAVAEETGLIGPLGQELLGVACEQFAQWRTDHPALRRISVNLAGRQLAEPGVVARIERTVAAAGLQAHHVCLELTETTLIESGPATRVALDRLVACDFGLGIDDFGTGYASLSYARNLPADTIKIDRSFVAGLTTSPEDRAVVAAVVSLARALGVQTVAEGIETPEQLAVLRFLGCGFGQGHLFSEPVEAAAFGRLLGRPLAPIAGTPAASRTIRKAVSTL